LASRTQKRQKQPKQQLDEKKEQQSIIKGAIRRPKQATNCHRAHSNGRFQRNTATAATTATAGAAAAEVGSLTTAGAVVTAVAKSSSTAALRVRQPSISRIARATVTAAAAAATSVALPSSFLWISHHGRVLELSIVEFAPARLPRGVAVGVHTTLEPPIVVHFLQDKSTYIYKSISIPKKEVKNGERTCV